MKSQRDSLDVGCITPSYITLLLRVVAWIDTAFLRSHPSGANDR